MDLNLSPQKERIYVLDVDVPVKTGWIPNRENSGDEITATIELATIAEQDKYSQFSMITNRGKKQKQGETVTKAVRLYDRCIIDKVKSISGLEKAGITNGATLVEKQKEHELFGNIVSDLYDKIMGYKDAGDGEEVVSLGE